MSDATNPDDVIAQAWRDNADAEKAQAPAAGGPRSSEQPATNPAGGLATASGAPPANDYADAWNRHDDYIDKASDAWAQARKDHPVGSAIAGMLPVAGQITSALEVNDAHNRGDKTGMAIAAAGLIPAGKLIVNGGKALRTGLAMEQVARAAQATPAATAAALKAAQVLKTRGAASVAGGAGATAANHAQTISDYIDAWRAQH